MNRVCEILGITKPVVQAPMTWITSPELAAAVSNAGGLGILGFNAGFEKEKQHRRKPQRKCGRWSAAQKN